MNLSGMILSGMASRARLRSGAALTSLVVALLAGALVAPPAWADGETEPPVTAPDTYSWYAGGSGPLNVLSNDSDPQGAPLAVCKVKQPQDPETGGAMLIADSLIAFTSGGSAPLVFSYYACNDEFLTPATVTIDVRVAAPLRVRKIPGRPGRLRVVNPNEDRAQILWGNARTGELQGRARVDASSSRVIEVRSSRIVWLGLIGRELGHAGYDQVGNIRLPDRARAITPRISPRLRQQWARR